MSLKSPHPRLLVNIAAILVWIGFVAAVVMWVPRVNVEAALRAQFPGARGDAFDGLHRLAPFASFVVSGWLFLVMCAILGRRCQSLVPLMLAPVIAAVIAAAISDWRDPAWFTIASIETLGFLVGTFVGAGCLLFGSRRRQAETAVPRETIPPDSGKVERN